MKIFPIVGTAELPEEAVCTMMEFFPDIVDLKTFRMCTTKQLRFRSITFYKIQMKTFPIMKVCGTTWRSDRYDDGFFFPRRSRCGNFSYMNKERSDEWYISCPFSLTGNFSTFNYIRVFFLLFFLFIFFNHLWLFLLLRGKLHGYICLHLV